jgi:hypothetical protein
MNAETLPQETNKIAAAHEMTDEEVEVHSQAF